nr:hypothetical protein [Tanacetum cinerariifolium]
MRVFKPNISRKFHTTSTIAPKKKRRDNIIKKSRSNRLDIFKNEAIPKSPNEPPRDIEDSFHKAFDTNRKSNRREPSLPFRKRRPKFPRLFAFEIDHNISVADKMSGSMEASFRRPVRGGVEHQQLDELYGEFSVKEVRLAIDNMVLPSHPEPT